MALIYKPHYCSTKFRPSQTTTDTLHILAD